ncbi:MAG: endonuclease/exonuclease/phosphatase family protein [Minwuia sp.]|nr:endonuclease/exonuclease/phosphatase family protein [Minwuia sp.]
MPRNPSTHANFPMIRIATFNIGMARLHLLGRTLREGVPHQRTRLPAIAAYLARNAEQADVWLLQEAYGRDVARLLARTPGFRAVAARTQGPDSGLVMLVRKGIKVSHAAALLFPAIDWVERFVARKGMHCIEISVDDQPFRIGNMHTSYDGRGRADVAARAPETRQRQITMALDSMERGAGDRVLVLGGDFNAAAALEPETFGLGALRGWLDARIDAETHDSSGVTTWSRQNPIINGDDPDQDIDHVWVRPSSHGLTMATHHVATAHDLMAPDGSMIPLSDHYGLAVEIRQTLPCTSNPEGEDSQ